MLLPLFRLPFAFSIILIRSYPLFQRHPRSIPSSIFSCHFAHVFTRNCIIVFTLPRNSLLQLSFPLINLVLRCPLPSIPLVQIFLKVDEGATDFFHAAKLFETVLQCLILVLKYYREFFVVEFFYSGFDVFR